MSQNAVQLRESARSVSDQRGDERRSVDGGIGVKLGASESDLRELLGLEDQSAAALLSPEVELHVVERHCGYRRETLTSVKLEQHVLEKCLTSKKSILSSAGIGHDPIILYVFCNLLLQ